MDKPRTHARVGVYKYPGNFVIYVEISQEKVAIEAVHFEANENTEDRVDKNKSGCPFDL